MEKYTGFSEENLKPCVQVFDNLAKSIITSSLKAVFKKFKSPKYFEVTRII